MRGPSCLFWPLLTLPSPSPPRLPLGLASPHACSYCLVMLCAPCPLPATCATWRCCISDHWFFSVLALPMHLCPPPLPLPFPPFPRSTPYPSIPAGLSSQRGNFDISPSAGFGGVACRSTRAARRLSTAGCPHRPTARGDHLLGELDRASERFRHSGRPAARSARHGTRGKPRTQMQVHGSSGIEGRGPPL